MSDKRCYFRILCYRINTVYVCGTDDRKTFVGTRQGDFFLSQREESFYVCQQMLDYVGVCVHGFSKGLELVRGCEQKGKGMGSLQRPDNGFAPWIFRSPFSWDIFQFNHIRFSYLSVLDLQP